MVGLYTGILNAVYKSEITSVDVSQSERSCRYVFKIEDTPFYVRGKKKSRYDQLNSLPVSDKSTLKNALRSHVFQLKKNNQIYFRDKLVTPIENTVFHLIGIQAILSDRIPHIAYSCFKDVVMKDSLDEEKLNLLKTLLQSMGWGVVKIMVKTHREIIIQLKHIPHGFQLEDDNWDFLIKSVLGYLWLLDKDFKVNKVNESYKTLSILYSTS